MTKRDRRLLGEVDHSVPAMLKPILEALESSARDGDGNDGGDGNGRGNGNGEQD